MPALGAAEAQRWASSLFQTVAIMSVKQQLADVRHGDIGDAFEAAKDLSSRSRPPVDEIIAILNESQNAHNREAAAYALSWVLGRRNQKPLEVLLATFDKVEESPRVRAQALEGFGLQRPTKRNRLWVASNPQSCEV